MNHYANINYPNINNMNVASPALSVRSNFSDMDDEELDHYLASCVPLSNLPTPPPAPEQPLPASTTKSLPSPPAESDMERHRPSPELEG
jgi:hypothetical protein